MKTIKKESMQHSISSIVSFAMSAISEAQDDARAIVAEKISELMSYLTTQLITAINRLSIES